MKRKIEVDKKKVLEFLITRKTHWISEGFPEGISHFRARRETQEALKKRGVENYEAVFLLHKLWDDNNCGCCNEKVRREWRE
jgi:hypothetical protein